LGPSQKTLGPSGVTSWLGAGVGAGNFFGVQRISCPNFPIFPEKFYATFSPCQPSLTVGTPFFTKLPQTGKLGT